MKNNEGVTLVELLVVVVVMGIIGAFAAVNISKTLESSEVKIDSYNLNTLNTVTDNLATVSGTEVDELFVGTESDQERMNILVDEGFITSPIEVLQDDAYFKWDTETNEWILEGGESIDFRENLPSYSFSESNLEDLINDGAVSNDMDNWLYNEDGFIENASKKTSRLFIPLAANEYSISATIQLSGSTSGGYGIFFDTYLKNDDADKDNGYILQFDRGYGNGALIIRPRTNGKEKSPVWNLQAKNTDLFPEKTIDPDWWLEEHTIKINVTNLDEKTRNVEIYLDNELVGNYGYKNKIKEYDIYTGFRTWGNSITKFYNIEVI